MLHARIGRTSECRPTPVTFICHACDCVEHRRTPALPEGWTSRHVQDDIHAFCADCGPKLASGELTLRSDYLAQLRRETITLAATLPLLILSGSGLWAMLPA